ncbi:hypothetical protein P9H04_05305 [Bacillus subtilis]|uniref:hypothetical protein n=1 Tax=Bacillus subtilis TaxID=1423 RepID=UPI002DBA4C36|nr:hypothetical protein [Bacillus subtilis]MEC2400487.1 hypothetical protein [Bacillus subtilis]
MDPGSSGRRSRSAGGGCQEPADKGREYGQASAEPAAGIQDLQEGRSRSARARCGPKWPRIWPARQLSPADAIQDLQEGAAGAPGRDGRNRPPM